MTLAWPSPDEATVDRPVHHETCPAGHRLVIGTPDPDVLARWAAEHAGCAKEERL